jgi:hypothetical protein
VPPFELAESLSELTRSYDFFVGRISRVALPINLEIGYGGVAPPTSTLPPGHPFLDPNHPKHSQPTPSEEEINRPIMRPYTIFEVEVVNPGTTDLKQGDAVFVSQGGGDWEGVRYELSDSPLLEVGGVYLLPLGAPGREPSFDAPVSLAGVAFMQFTVDGDVLKPVHERWADLPAVKELAGMKLEAALAALVEARREWDPDPAVVPPPENVTEE